MEEKKYIITHPAFEKHAPAELQGMQVYIKPYLQEMIIFWWFVFFCTSLVLLSLFVKRVYTVHFKKIEHSKK
jgi:hypothetical protein